MTCRLPVAPGGELNLIGKAAKLLSALSEADDTSPFSHMQLQVSEAFVDPRESLCRCRQRDGLLPLQTATFSDLITESIK